MERVEWSKERGDGDHGSGGNSIPPAGLAVPLAVTIFFFLTLCTPFPFPFPLVLGGGLAPNPSRFKVDIGNLVLTKGRVLNFSEGKDEGREDGTHRHVVQTGNGEQNTDYYFLKVSKKKEKGNQRKNVLDKQTEQT